MKRKPKVELVPVQNVDAAALKSAVQYVCGDDPALSAKYYPRLRQEGRTDAGQDDAKFADLTTMRADLLALGFMTVEIELVRFAFGQVRAIRALKTAIQEFPS